VSESFRERLARLRREPTSAPPPAQSSPSPSPAELPSWWRSRLAKRAAPPRVDTSEPRELGEPAGLVDASNLRGAFAVREQRFALDHRHGSTELSSVHSVRSELFALLTKDARLAAFDPARALFLDIETTGLAGGAGTKAFLVGLGRIEGAEFVLWQGFLRGPEQEAALLHDVAERIAASSALVTFFGKTFDRHRLEDKMRVHGVPPPFAARPHLDLYHPLRALYRPALPDSRLGTLERALCRVERTADLSGAFAPEAWYDFLAGRPHRLSRVFAHNRDDVLSLVTLCAHLGALEFAPRDRASPSDADAARLEAARLRGLARALFHAKRWSECAALATCALELAESETARAELLELAQTAERRAERAARRGAP
jgi:uncharacterized protein YprB with RNaseH-like and TPR domain